MRLLPLLLLAYLLPWPAVPDPYDGWPMPQYFDVFDDLPGPLDPSGDAGRVPRWTGTAWEWVDVYTKDEADDAIADAVAGVPAPDLSAYAPLAGTAPFTAKQAFTAGVSIVGNDDNGPLIVRSMWGGQHYGIRIQDSAGSDSIVLWSSGLSTFGGEADFAAGARFGNNSQFDADGNLRPRNGLVFDVLDANGYPAIRFPASGGMQLPGGAASLGILDAYDGVRINYGGVYAANGAPLVLGASSLPTGAPTGNATVVANPLWAGAGMTVTGVVRSDAGFNVAGTPGYTGTYPTDDGRVATVIGGIVADVS